jgi:two-component system LytT family response regulator
MLTIMKNSNLSFQIGKEVKFIPQESLMYCLADRNYTEIISSNGHKILTTKSLRELESLLDPEIFVRVNNSHIINTMYVKNFHNGSDRMLEMQDGRKLEVSRRKKKQFLAMFIKL